MEMHSLCASSVHNEGFAFDYNPQLQLKSFSPHLTHFDCGGGVQSQRLCKIGHANTLRRGITVREISFPNPIDSESDGGPLWHLLLFLWLEFFVTGVATPPFAVNQCCCSEVLCIASFSLPWEASHDGTHNGEVENPYQLRGLWRVWPMGKMQTMTVNYQSNEVNYIANNGCSNCSLCLQSIELNINKIR